MGQLGNGEMSSTYNTVQLMYVQYPWVDVNGDRFVQANEVVMTAAPLGFTTGYDYLNPTRTTTPGTVDPNLSADSANEFLATFDKQIASDFAVSASYIWRRYQNFRANNASDFGAATGRRSGGRRPRPPARPAATARRSPTTSRPARSR